MEQNNAPGSKPVIHATKLERTLYSIVDEESDERPIAKVFNYVIITLILLSVVEMVLETIQSVYDEYYVYLKAFEIFSIIVFTFEFLARVITARLAFNEPNRLKAISKYVFSFYGLVDLISILPFYLPMIGVDLRVVRTLRLLRFLRLFKIARYNDSLSLIKSVMLEKRAEIGVSCFVIIIVMVIASFIMYYAENEAQPEQFPNVLACVWWAIVTLTTVGYGDVYPITLAGKIIGGLIAFLGIGLVALPTGIISAGFLEKINQKAEEIAEAAKAKHGDDHQHTHVAHDDGQKHFCPYCGHRID